MKNFLYCFQNTRKMYILVFLKFVFVKFLNINKLVIKNQDFLYTQRQKIPEIQASRVEQPLKPTFFYC